MTFQQVVGHVRLKFAVLDDRRSIESRPLRSRKVNLGDRNFGSRSWNGSVFWVLGTVDKEVYRSFTVLEQSKGEAVDHECKPGRISQYHKVGKRTSVLQRELCYMYQKSPCDVPPSTTVCCYDRDDE